MGFATAGAADGETLWTVLPELLLKSELVVMLTEGAKEVATVVAGGNLPGETVGFRNIQITNRFQSKEILRNKNCILPTPIIALLCVRTTEAADGWSAGLGGGLCL